MDDERVDEKKAAVSAWMLAHGWPVDENLYTRWYLWRSHAVRPVITLFMTQNVFDDHSATELVRILDRLQADKWLRSAPKKYTIIRESDASDRHPEVWQIDELPKDIIRPSQRSSVRL